MLIQDLPPELLGVIFLHLDPLSAIRCRAVCREWKDLGKSKMLLRAFCQRLGFLRPGQTLTDLRNPNPWFHDSHIAWSDIHGEGELRGLRNEDLVTYDEFFRISIQLDNAWPTQRFPTSVRATVPTATAAEDEDLCQTGVSPLPDAATVAKQLSLTATDRPSLLKMYSLNLRRHTVWPEQALYDRADDCLVVSLSDERGVAVLDAGTGRLLSLNRLPTAQGSVKGQLSMSEGWLVDVSGDNEICIWRFERTIQGIQEPRRGALRRWAFLKIPHKIQVYRWHFPTLVIATEDYHCLVYDVTRKLLTQDFLLRDLPRSGYSDILFCNSTSVDFDEDYVYLTYRHHSVSEQGKHRIFGVLRIYAREDNSCLWTLSADDLFAISSAFIPLSHGRKNFRDRDPSGNWPVLSQQDLPLSDNPGRSWSTALLDVCQDKATDSLLVLGAWHIFVIRGYGSKMRGRAAGLEHHALSDFSAGLTIVRVRLSGGESNEGRLAASNGRAAFTVDFHLVIMDVDAVIRSTRDSVSQRDTSAFYVQRMPHWMFLKASSVQMDASSLTTVARFDGFLHRLRPSARAQAQTEDIAEGASTNNLLTPLWQRELARRVDGDMYPLEKVVVFDFGQLAREMHAAGSHSSASQRGKGTTLCYPSGETLATLQRSGHMIMHPELDLGCIEEGPRPDSEELRENWEDDGEEMWVPSGVACKCVPYWLPAG